MKLYKKLQKIIENCYLCLRFPFLYSRNRFSGLHYNSWRIHDYLHGKMPKYKCVKQEDGSYASILDTPETNGIWDKAFENVQETKYFSGSPYDSLRTVTKSKFWAAWYYTVEFWHNHVLQWIHCIPTFTELDAMESGWRKAFGIQMCEEIKQALKKHNYLYKYRITQIKEKFGTLRWYDEGAPREVHDIISKYEDISWNTCIICGKPSIKITAGWISPYCDDCFPKDHLVYEEKMPDGTWQETEEYRARMDEIKKDYAKDKEKI